MLLICLANAHNTSTGLCCPSIDRLAQESGMGRSTVKRWLRWLQEHRYLAIIESHHESGRQQAHNYRLTLGEGSNLGQTQSDPQPDSDPPEGSNCEPPLKEPEEGTGRTSPNPQGGDGRKAFRRLWESWPVDHLPDNLEYCLKQFLKLSDVERAYAEEVVDLYRRRCSIRGAHPRLIPYLKEKQFLDLVDAPEMDKDGDFIVTPKHRLEWSEWLGHLRQGRSKADGDKAVAYHVSLQKIIVKTRWPDGFGRLPAVKE